MVLRGAMNLLQELCEMVFHTVAAGRKKKKRGPDLSFKERDDWAPVNKKEGSDGQSMQASSKKGREECLLPSL